MLSLFAFLQGSFTTALHKQGTREAELLFTNCRERGKMKAESFKGWLGNREADSLCREQSIRLILI